jgi:UDP-glucose 4-epimerase
MLRDIAMQRREARRPFSAAILRYFNVAGCDRQGRLGEDHDPETHLIPLCLDVALGRRGSIEVFGDDYATPDGTCVRDYVHVDDLVAAHLLALDALGRDGITAHNVGLGRGDSVLAVIDACRRATGHAIPATMAPRRPGDPPTLYSDARRIRAEWGWNPQVTSLDAIVESAWTWRRAHPHGY